MYKRQISQAVMALGALSFAILSAVHGNYGFTGLTLSILYVGMVTAAPR